MKKLIIAALTIATMAACTESNSDSNNAITEAELSGTWVFNKVNNEEVITNEVFACTFKDGYQDFIQWGDVDGTNSTITYKEDVPYTIATDTLTLSSTEDHIVLKVTIDGDSIAWTEIEKIISGEDYYMGYSYQGYRATTDYSEQITQGVWEGRATEGRTENPYLRISYNTDGTYDFQYRESESDEWSEKLDNDGRYYLLGDLLGSVWINDINTGVEGSSSETWIISIEDDTMIWTATRTDDHYESFEFTRVE